ncbi:TonB-dependent receptor [Thalassotalea sp. ND16A]|uniref:TonB-dependent receptor n=1 Tax=Thalassotalea sp. ND16A TaxID=1535422 RepID=UPI0013646E53|nr:TonB-dependent receptor [Thalassotalea sp. ND16A]
MNKTFIVLCLLSFCLVINRVEAIDDKTAEVLYEFNIPAQPLSQSLNQLSDLSEISLLFPYDLVENKMGSPVKGLYTAQQALTIILRKSGLEGELSDKKVFLITPKRQKEKSLLESIIALIFSPAQDSEDKTENIVVAAKQTKEIESIEKIEIYGIKDGLSKALLTKRAADSVLDSISAEGIGSFPDNNIAESIQRVPGVSITRAFGEGEFVSIRGFSPGLNLTMVNGQQLASSAFELETSMTRGFNFSLLPAELVQRIDVFKSPEARLAEGGIGGTVNVHTRKPLAQKKAMVAGSISSSYNDLTSSKDPKVFLMGSWKNDEETFGVLFSGDYQQRKLRRDAVEVLGYIQNDFYIDGELVGEDILYPRNIGSALFQQERIRNTIMVTLQWRPNNHWDVTLNAIDSRMDGDNTNNNLLSLQHSLKTFNHPQNAVSAVTIDEAINTATVINWLDTDPAFRRELSIGTISRQSKLTTKATDLAIAWHKGAWDIKAQIGHTKATGGSGFATFTAFATNGDFTTNITDGIGYTDYGDIDTVNPDNFTLNNFVQNDISNVQKQQFAQLDFEYQTHGDFITSVMFGAKYQDMSQQRNRLRTQGFLTAEQRALTMSDIVGDNVSLTPDDYLNDISNNAINNYVIPNNDTVINYVQNNDFDLRDDIFVSWPYKIKEKLTALYVQANYYREINDIVIRGNVGLRAAHAKTDTLNFSNLVSQIDAAAGLYDYHGEGESTNFLPSANVAFDFDNDIILRLAAARVLSRPTYTDLASQLVLSEEPIFQGQSGNADLEPFLADKLDISTELYYSDASSVSLAVFYYDIHSFVAKRVAAVDVYDDGQLWDITRPYNADGGHIKGAEFALLHNFASLPAPFDGLGVKLNYTYVESESTEVDPSTGDFLPLAGLSKNTLNAVLFYSKDAWNARLAYNHRSDYFEQIEREFPRFTDSAGYLSAKLSYRLNNNVTVFIQGQNLSDTVKYRYIGVQARPFQTSNTGRIVSAGVDFQF